MKERPVPVRHRGLQRHRARRLPGEPARAALSAWVVREAGCGAVLGSGISFKPIGVYFAARDTESVAVPGSSVIGFLPDGAGGPGGYAPGAVFASPQASDAGAADAGTTDAGTADAGTADAGTTDAGGP